MIIRKSIMTILCVCFMAVSAVASAADTTVETIAVEIVPLQNGHPIEEKISKRMQASVYTIADNVLSGHATEEIVRNQAGYEALIQDVFSRILIGYSVQTVKLDVEKNTTIEVVVVPWHNVIHEVKVDVGINGVTEEISPLIEQDIQGVEKIFLNVLQDLPIDAVEWVNGVLRTGLNDFIALRLPEFNATFQLNVNDTNGVEVKLELYPKGMLIRDIDIAMHSDTIPNAILLTFRPSINKQLDCMVGLPTAFVKRHQEYFVDRFAAFMNDDSRFQQYGIQSHVGLTVDSQTKVLYTIDSSEYRLNFEGYLDIGKEERNTSFKAHAGKMLNQTNEIFLEMYFFPHQMEWDFYPGILHSLTPETKVGFKYDLDDAKGIFFVNQSLSKRLILRVEHTPSNEFTEFGLRYRLHDFFDIEYVMNDDEKWVRLIGIL